MKIIEIGTRSKAPCIVNLSQGWRMGDFAGLRIILEHWRRSHPAERMIVMFNAHHKISLHSKDIPLEWVFKGIADELRVTEAEGDGLIRPVGRDIRGKDFCKHIWVEWAELHKLFDRHDYPPTAIRPPQESLDRAQALLDKYEVPENFVAMQPLCDAGYNKGRNAPPSWWRSVAHEVSQRAPTVMLGTPETASLVHLNKGVYPLWEEKLSPMDSLAIISKATTMAGGETGMTIWAGMFGVPIAAIYRNWKPVLDAAKRVTDFRPISFGGAVQFIQIRGAVTPTANSVANLFDAHVRGRTQGGIDSRIPRILELNGFEQAPKLISEAAPESLVPTPTPPVAKGNRVLKRRKNRVEKQPRERRLYPVPPVAATEAPAASEVKPDPTPEARQQRVRDRKLIPSKRIRKTLRQSMEERRKKRSEKK